MGVHAMKRFIVLALLCSFAAFANQAVNGQTRPRRVGQTPPVQAPAPSEDQTQPQQPSDDSSQTARPSRRQAPAGANRNPNEQKPSSTQQKDAGPEEVGAGDVVRVDTTLVSIPVSVMDRDGKYIPNLRKEDFRIWEDGVEQSVAFFSSVDKPFSVVLMIDTSGSTRFRLDDIQDAAITFVNQLRQDDRVMVVSFDDQVRVLSEFTSDRYRLRDAIRRTRPGDGTKLYEALDLVMNQRLNRVDGRKAVVLFTDGVDTTRRYASYASNIRDAEELDALIYPVQYDTYTDMSGGAGGGWPGGVGLWPSSPADILGQILGGRNRRGGMGGGGVGTSRREYEIANRYLHELADRTGARDYQADSTQNLSLAFANIAEELRRQYSLGYYPTKPAQAGERRQIKVRVNQPNLAVRTRNSYIFNPANTARDDTAAQKSAPVLQKKLQGTGIDDDLRLRKN